MDVQKARQVARRWCGANWRLNIGDATGDVVFAGADVRSCLLRVPAPIALSLRKVSIEAALPMRRGTLKTSNARSIHKLVLPHLCSSASLCLGLTRLDPGSVWNMMQPHVHERRTEIYLYFDLGEDGRAFHHMGRPDALRHIVMAGEQGVISPPRSVHMGAETRNYTFARRWRVKIWIARIWT